jgi:sulfite reductase beta subunit-like hemoprotein
MAEIAFVGKAPNKYQIYLGGDVTGTRLNRLFKDSVKGEDLMNELKPVLTRYARERQPGESWAIFARARSGRKHWPPHKGSDGRFCSVEQGVARPDAAPNCAVGDPFG